MEPINYLLNNQSPMASLQNGLQFAQDQRMGEQDMQMQLLQEGRAASQEERAQTQFGQANTLFDQGQQDRVAGQQAQQQEAEAARARAMALQSDMADLADKLGEGNATANDIRQLTLKHPDLAEELGKMWDGVSAERKAADVSAIYKVASLVKGGQIDMAVKMLEERAAAALAGGDQETADMAKATIATIKSDPAAALAMLAMGLEGSGTDANDALFGAGGAEELPADIRSLQFRADAAGLVNGTQEYKDFMQSGGGNEGDAPASFRALELQAEAAGLVKGSDKYKKFMETKGAGSVAQASAEGSALGQNITLLASMESKLPGLETVVAELEVLADAATYTKAGLANDAFRKETGMEPRPSAIARAEYIAVVDNQVLPLLRDTFGAAFTQKEGDTLKATLGDPSKSPAEKKAVMRAFIKQKKRDVEELGNQISDVAAGSGSPEATGQAFDPAEIPGLLLGPPKR